MSIIKAEHTFSEKQRVKFTHEGVEHHGRITAINARNQLVVRTDSGHTMLVNPTYDNASPEDFPTHTSSETPAKATITVAQLDGLRRALALGKLDAVDELRVRDCFAKLETVVSLDGPETEWERTLREMVKKHLGASAGTDGGFAKAAASYPTYKIGDRVRDKWGCVGKITAVDESHAEIKYDNGSEGTVLHGYFKAA